MTYGATVRKHGLWCPACALPCAMEVQVFSLSLLGVSQETAWTICPEKSCAWQGELVSADVG